MNYLEKYKMKKYKKQSKKIGIFVLLYVVVSTSFTIAATVASERIRLEAALQRNPLQAKAEIASFMSSLKAADAAYKEAVAAGISKNDQKSLQSQGNGAAGPTLTVRQPKIKDNWQETQSHQGGRSSSIDTTELLNMFKLSTYTKKPKALPLTTNNIINDESLYNKGATVLKNINDLAEQYEQEIEMLNQEAEILEAQNMQDDLQTLENNPAHTQSIKWQEELVNIPDTSPAIYTIDGSLNGLSIGICADKRYHAKPMDRENLKKPWYIPIYYIYPDTIDIGIGSILIAADSPKLQTCSCIAQYTTRKGTSCTVCTGGDGLAKLAYVNNGPAEDCNNGAEPAHKDEFSVNAQNQKEQMRDYDNTSQIYYAAKDNTNESLSTTYNRVLNSAKYIHEYTLEKDFDTALDTHDKGQDIQQPTIFSSLVGFIRTLYTNTMGVFY